MKVSIIGIGYVGLPTAVCLADFGWDIYGIDKNQTKIDKLNVGEIVLFEKGLKELFNKNRSKIRFTTSMESISLSDIVIIAVGTPSKENGGFDLSFIYDACEEIPKYLKGYTCIVIKSTVPPGTNKIIKKLIKDNNPSAEFDLVYLPEFLREGFAVENFFNPDRIIIGTDSKRAIDTINKLYKPMKSKNILITSVTSAEIIKHASNSFLAMKIEFINEISDLCEKVGGDIDEVSMGIGLDKRIGDKFLNSGPGFGGSCLPKDTKSILNIAKSYNVNLPLISKIIEGNNNRQINMSKKILNEVKNFENPKVGVLGLAFKGGTDDCRESPAIEIVNNLLKNKLKIIAYDPKAMENSKFYLKNEIDYAKDEYKLAKDIDCLTILTDWDQFKKIDLEKIKSLMKHKIIIDLRNIINKEKAINIGFKVIQIGKK
jgi:UDPglucose 6-dehydrogenase